MSRMLYLMEIGSIYLLADGWYFSDETWTDHGPYETQEEAFQAHEQYCLMELGCDMDDESEPEF